jgi:ABC-2 type transport system ATP-binding protein
MLLEVDHLSFSYGSKRALEDVTFDVAPGEIVGIVGANGAGKSTLLKILANVLMQDAGRVAMDGTDPLLRPIKYRKGIGYLPETCPLYREMTVADYLVYRSRLKGERGLRVRHRVRESMDACGLSDVTSERIRNLSQGFRKRVGLADALIRRPRLLLLDDLLAGIDVVTRKLIGETLTAVSARAAILVAGHELREMADWCTRFLVLSEGRLVETVRTCEHDSNALLKEIAAQE